MIEKNGYSRKCLVSESNHSKTYLFKSFDIIHGYGYFCKYITYNNFIIGNGFSRNKFSAVRMAKIDNKLKSLELYLNL